VEISGRSWQLNFATAAAVWAVVVCSAALAGVWMGYNDRRFVIALAVGALLFGLEFLLAAPAFYCGVRRWLAERVGVLLALVPLCAVLVYGVGVGGDLKVVVIGAAYTIVPPLLLAGAAGKSPGRWEDYIAACVVWLPVEFRWMYRLYPYPPPLTHTLTILTALSVGVVAFVVIRRPEDVGYAIEWRRGFGFQFWFNFVVFAAIAIPLGIKIGFITWGPSVARMKWFPVTGLGILFFTAWPEEFLFRGLLQNLFSRTLKNEWAGLAIASIVFGFSHVLHKPFPNWKYVLLATIAGVFYGRAYMKTKSLVPGALVHGLVDLSWHVLFR
jgi:uncharacterized protein